MINLSRTRPDGLPSNAFHLACDLSCPDETAAAAAEVVDLLRSDESPGKILWVNNSGTGAYGRFQDLPLGRHLQQVDLNLLGTVGLTLHVLPELLRRGGTVVTIASTSAYQPTPMMATYGATKVFLLHWSLALGDDLRGTGVRTLAVCPGPTATAFAARAGFRDQPRCPWGFQTVDAVVEATLRGVARGRLVVVPGWGNRLVVALSLLAPRAVASRVAGWLMRRAVQRGLEA